MKPPSVWKLMVSFGNPNASSALSSASLDRIPTPDCRNGDSSQRTETRGIQLDTVVIKSHPQIYPLTFTTMNHIIVVMPQVSKIRLRKEIEERMFKVFFQSMANAKSPKEAKILLNDLLTPTEKIMLAKRLAIALLFLRGYNYSDIRQILKVSYGTISQVANRLKTEGSGYRKIVTKMARQEVWKDLLNQINDIFVGMTPSPYDKRYRDLKKALEKKAPF